MIVLIIIIAWLSSGFIGSAIIIHVVGSVHPWLGLRPISLFPCLMSVGGPLNLVAASVYAAIFWRDYRAIGRKA